MNVTVRLLLLLHDRMDREYKLLGNELSQDQARTTVGKALDDAGQDGQYEIVVRTDAAAQFAYVYVEDEPRPRFTFGLLGTPKLSEERKEQMREAVSG